MSRRTRSKQLKKFLQRRVSDSKKTSKSLSCRTLVIQHLPVHAAEREPLSLNSRMQKLLQSCSENDRLRPCESFLKFVSFKPQLEVSLITVLFAFLHTRRLLLSKTLQIFIIHFEGFAPLNWPSRCINFISLPSFRQ